MSAGASFSGVEEGRGHALRRAGARLAIVACVAAVVLLLPDPAVAGPGGKIARAVADSFWAKLVLGVLFVLFLPVILWVSFKEARAKRRTMANLRRLAAVSPQFDWMPLKERIVACFHRVHAAWSKEDMEEASSWMTDWYWQNQQVAFLERWQREGLVNHCKVRSVKNVRPLHLEYRNLDGSHGGTRLVVAIDADMEDYLAERDSGKVIEGKKGFRDVETVWTFLLEGDAWRVANIEESHLSLEYAGMADDVPDVLPGETERA